MAKPQLLSEPEAWRLIAEQNDEAQCGAGYLCDRIAILVMDGRIAWPSQDRMYARVKTYLAPGELSGFPDFDCTGHDTAPYRKARVLAALWMALDAEEESRAGKGSR